MLSELKEIYLKYGIKVSLKAEINSSISSRVDSVKCQEYVQSSIFDENTTSKYEEDQKVNYGQVTYNDKSPSKEELKDNGIKNKTQSNENEMDRTGEDFDRPLIEAKNKRKGFWKTYKESLCIKCKSHSIIYVEIGKHEDTGKRVFVCSDCYSKYFSFSNMIMEKPR